jgi:isopentenyldiphosphate isomerase
MSPKPSHAQAFLSHLQGSQLDWLINFVQTSTSEPPAHWLPWSSDGHLLGWVSPERGEQMVVHLPGCVLRERQLDWQSNAKNAMQRSQILQNFLQIQADRGRLEGWRDEYFNYWLKPSTPPLVTDVPWLCVERAGFRHLGLMSHAVHINGFCTDGRLWCAQRSQTKATDPGLWDNLTAGGLTAGEDAIRTVRRELKEEAGWNWSHRQNLHGCGSVRTRRLEPQGWHDEVLLVYNLEIPDTFQPINQDGEVQAFACWGPDQVVSGIQAGQFTADAAHALCRGLGLTRNG